MLPSLLSRRVLTEVFGPEFVASLDESPSTKTTLEQLHNTTTDDGPTPNKTLRRTESQNHLLSHSKQTNWYDNLHNEMSSRLSSCVVEGSLLEEEEEGRLGPGVVKYDVASYVGSFIISNDRLGVNSQCNFGSVRASSCVFKGKWQYEIQLGSNGVMQVGWATLDTKFSQEKGVGDTLDSFAYDGNRLRKWNKSTAQYGETWQAGDIIGCCIDLDEGTIEFLRNGKSLGVAFTSIRKGANVAYFPAISLAYQENIVANFGATPLQFPLTGHSPLQKATTSSNTKSSLLLSWLSKVLPLFNSNLKTSSDLTHRTLLVITNRIMEFLGPHLHSAFVVEQSFFPFFATTLGLPLKVTHSDLIQTDNINHANTNLLLDVLWTLLEESEMKSCLERMTVLLMNQFRSNSLSPSYPFQHYSLQCLLALCSHRKTRRYLIRNLLFDRSSRLMQFLHVRPMDESVLKEVIPETWWPGKSPDDSPAAISYQNACRTIHSHVQQIESLQVEFLKALLCNHDGTEKRPSSRALFLRKFRTHVRDVIRPGSVLQQPVSKAMCTFFAFLKTISSLSSEELGSSSLPSLPSSLFYDTSISYFEMERVGGLASFLYKTHHVQVSNNLAIPDYHPTTTDATTTTIPPADTPIPGLIHVSTQNATNPMQTDDNLILTSNSSTEQLQPPPPQFATLITGTPSGHNALLPMVTDFRSLISDQGFTFYPGGFLGFANFEHNNRGGVHPQNPAVALLGKDFGSIDPLFSLRELLDDAIIIFTAGVQSNIEKVVTMRRTMEEYKEALSKAEDNLSSCKTEGERVEVEKSIEIFTKKLEEQGRNLAWIQSAVFTQERQQLAHQLLNTILNTLNQATNTPLFCFVPEHYVSSLINLNWLLLTQMHPTVPHNNIQDLPTLLSSIAEFVATHFSDPRIVIAETKDTLTQALSTFICNETMLRAVEEMSAPSQVIMIKAILRPYENRAWAQSNWMLVRMWQGDGFGFQFPNSLEARRSYRAKPVQDEFGISTNLPPTPSRILQSHVADVLLSDQSLAASYIHSVLNQLNWALSEFVGLLQEIQTASSRPERVFIESRQLKICCTCFELTQALLRVMEMIVSIAPPLLTDFSRESAEPLLSRLCMLLSQVLNRIGSNSGSFGSVMELDIVGLENVTHFPILSAVAGILVALIKRDLHKNTESEVGTTRVLLSEPSFQVTSLNFFTGGSTEGRRTFSLRNHTPSDISEAELVDLENVIGHLTSWSARLEMEAESIDEEIVCTICYASPQNATLKPCNHRTCKACILHHLMNRGECFFCKAVIEQVFLDDGSKIHDMTS